jgi:HipA-like kinase
VQFHCGASRSTFLRCFIDRFALEQFFLRHARSVTSMAAMRLAVEHVRRMRGGAQAQLMRCDDEAYYIVKFQNNPQHLRILANEMLATRLAARLGLCVPQVEVVEVRRELIAATAELVIQLALGRAPCAEGKQFGSQFPGHPARLAVHDFLPDEQLRAVKNLCDFLGVLVFDKWTCNTNGRQAIFFRDPGAMAEPAAPAAGRCRSSCHTPCGLGFPRVRRRGLHARRLYGDDDRLRLLL